MSPKPRRKRPTLYRFITRALMALCVLGVFGALWLLDTAALLHVTRAAILTHPLVALALAGGLALAITVSGWLARRPKRRRKMSRKH